jgi:hypothetical protein
MVVHASNTSYSGGRGRRIERSRTIQAKLGRPYLNIKIQEKGLEHGSSGRTLAKHV